MTFRITETTVYEIDADSEQDAEDRFLGRINGPPPNVRLIGITERTVERYDGE